MDLQTLQEYTAFPPIHAKYYSLCYAHYDLYTTIIIVTVIEMSDSVDISVSFQSPLFCKKSSRLQYVSPF